MNKTYWWRLLLILVNFALFGYGYASAYVSKLGFTYNPYTDPILFLSVFLFPVFLATFFITDHIFTKWLRFAIVWFILALILIYIAPTINRGMDFVPTKELTSIWMGALFVVISFVKIVWDIRKTRREDA